MLKRILLLSAASVPLATLCSISVLAQTAGMDEIIVTAQKREQSLQDVPIAITAIGASDLNARGLNNVDGLSGVAPNLVVEAGNTSSSSVQVSIRGSVTINVGGMEDPAVGIYMDGVYLGRGFGSVFDIPDLERVEVLRGPQGTLFGRNTLAGAISLVSTKPSDRLRVEGEVSYGNRNYMAAKGLLNLPITDSLFVKVAGQTELRDGFTRVVPDPLGFFPIKEHGDLDDRNRQSLMAQVRWEPDARVTIDYSYLWSRSREHPLSALAAVGAGNIFDPDSPLYIPGMPADRYVVHGENRPDTVSIERRMADRARVQSHILNVDFDIGNNVLRSITAYRDVDIDQGVNGLDVDGTPMLLAAGGFIQHFKQFSQEIQLIGEVGDQLNYVIGGYYLFENAQSRNPQTYFFGSSAFDTASGVRTRAFATFANVDYRVTDKLKLSAGLRWTRERKQVNRFYQILAIDPDPGLPLPLTTIDITKADDVHDTFSNVSPAATLAYDITPDINIYGRYAVGFRSGNFNSDAADAVMVRTSYRPEKNESFEAGLKSRFFDRRLQLNVAAFYNNEKDKQVAVFVADNTAVTLNQNAGRAKSYGLEVELDARPVDALRIYGSVGLLRTKFKEYLDTDVAGRLLNVADNRFYAKAPRTTITAGADLTLADRERTGRWTLSGDVLHQSRVFAMPGQYVFDPVFPLVSTADELFIPALTIANARLRWELDRGDSARPNLYAVLWVNNITNYRKFNNKLAFGPNFGGLVIANYHQPRTYGVTLGFKY